MSVPPPIDIPRQLAMAAKAWTKLRRVAAYAAFDGWSLTILGGLTLICGGYGSALGLLISFVLLGTGIFEIRSVRQLRQLSPTAIARIAYNQLALAGALIAYAMIGLVQCHLGRMGGGMPTEIEQAIAQTGGSGEEIKNQISAAMEIFYILLIVVAMLVQGGTALYYFSRQKHLQQYLQETPDWIQQMQRERGEV